MLPEGVKFLGRAARKQLARFFLCDLPRRRGDAGITLAWCCYRSLTAPLQVDATDSIGRPRGKPAFDIGFAVTDAPFAQLNKAWS